MEIIRKIKAVVITLILLAFSAGGWILFVCSEIKRNKEITRELNIQTEKILNQMHRRDSIFASENNDSIFGDK